jgi:hypothetical protein
MSNSERETRREIIKKAVYVAPAILSLTASPAFAQRGSGPPRGDDDRDKRDKDKPKDKDKHKDKHDWRWPRA